MTKRVYYLDDEKRLCDMIQLFFDGLDVEFQAFVDPEVAIRAANKVPPDLMFIDYHLPGMSGDEVAQRIQGTVPMILISGESNTHSQFPFLDVMTKPFSFEVLLGHVQHYCLDMS